MLSLKHLHKDLIIFDNMYGKIMKYIMLIFVDVLKQNCHAILIQNTMIGQINDTKCLFVVSQI